MRPLLLLALIALTMSMANGTRAAGPYAPYTKEGGVNIGLDQQQDILKESKENTRLVASGLAFFLGPFGAHRLYLGTTPKVAVIYGITFAGFGTLVLLDLGQLLFTKDMEPFRNNDRVFMWNPRSEEVTPR